MPRVYLDTNIYIIGLLSTDTNSKLLLEEVKKGNIKVILSDYLFDEALTWFKSNKGKDCASKVRLYLLSIPKSEIIYDLEWNLFMDEWGGFVADIDDIPHVCSYFAGESEYFVTVNRRLTQMKIKDYVNFISPKRFIEDVCLLDGIETNREI
ncbi:MAG: hypothetical protein C4B59_01790 [Candidatus Methanogaster sp.]|uniref:Uncharacterized protein n=1 Tax=Candidatus Methanogaster sp. TaxID=3386292 RepID=A0AC61L6C1_9EURY|nr:MAG: hypothetical protein C4B59_01790 [ANME-2 cluster archaeon]